MATKLMLAMGLLVMITASTLAFLSYRSMERRLLEDSLLMMSSQADRASVILQEYAAYTRQDLLACRMSPAVQELADELAAGADTVDGETLQRARALLLAQISARPSHLQLRFISAGPLGMEIVRLERDAEGGPPVIVAEADLQPKGSRDYFLSGLELGDGEVHVTPIELNVEFGRIQEPRLPVMRFLTPVLSTGGELSGLLVINLDMRPVLERLRSAAPAGWESILVSADREFLIHPDQGREFGLQTGSGHWLADDDSRHAGLLAMLSAHERDTAMGSLQGMSGVMQSFSLADQIRVQLFFLAEDRVLHGSLASVRNTYLLTTLFCIACALLLAVFVARGMARPLERMTRAIRTHGSAAAASLPVDAGGEIGVLARSFGNLLAELDANSAALQEEISIRRQAEEIASSQARRMLRYHTLVEDSVDAIISKDLEGRILSWNPAAEKLYGYSREETIGKHINLIIPQEQQAEIEEASEKILRGEEVEPFETLRRRRDGSLVDVSLTVSPIHDPDGRVDSFSVRSRDITDAKFTEGLFRLVVEASPSGIVLVNDQGQIVMINRLAESLFDYPPGELLGSNIERLVPADLRSGHEVHRQGFIADPEARMMGAGRDLFGLRRDGSVFPIEIGLNPVQTSRGLMVLSMVIDISDRKRAEQVLEEKTRDLERSNQDLEQFAYIASHDLKEPLRMISSYTELLSERYSGKLDEKADRYIGFARDGALRMQRMIADLLAYSRASNTPFTPEPVEMEDVLKAVRFNLRQEISDSDAMLDADELPRVLGNEQLLGQLMQNLLSNAIKFRGEEAPRIRITCSQTGNRWRICVEDNGIGIEEQHRERIFQMFQRLHERGRYEGSGIGLAIARKVVDVHGGVLTCDSLPGGGSVFCFTLQSAE